MAAYRIEKLHSWEHCKEVLGSDDYRSWAFRGQRASEWKLWSTLSRYLRLAGVHPDAWAGQEERMLRVFQRKAHLHLQHVASDEDAFQWLGLLQHHGGPT